MIDNMDTREPRLNQELLENRRQADWESSAVFQIATGNYHHSTRFDIYINGDRVSAETVIDRKKQKEFLEGLMNNLEYLTQQLSSMSNIPEHIPQMNVIRKLHEYIRRYYHLCKEDADTRLMYNLDSSSLSSTLTEKGARTIHTDIVRPQRHYQNNERAIQDILDQTDRRYLLSTSDSHFTTGAIIGAAREYQWIQRPTAVISFDRHTDLQDYMLNVLGKANVMAYMLKYKLIDRIGVFGVDENILLREDTPTDPDVLDNSSVIMIQNLYTNSKPDKQKFLHHLHSLFTQWQKSGIEQIYTSVDIDGLRLAEHGYTGTDYNAFILRLMRILQKPELQQLCEQAVVDIHSGSTEGIEQLVQLAKDIIVKPCPDVPASWIIHAMQIAREQYGFILGIQHAESKKQIVGDIVEFTQPDYQGRTEKIAYALLNGMLSTVQSY